MNFLTNLHMIYFPGYNHYFRASAECVPKFTTLKSMLLFIKYDD